MQSYLSEYKGSREDPVEKFNRSVESFLMQDHDDKELIIVSDGCEITNNTYELEWSMFDNIKLIKTDKEPNRWVGSKRNYGIEAADGEWITYLDSDDIIIETRLSDLYKSIQENPTAKSIMSNGNELYPLHAINKSDSNKTKSTGIKIWGNPKGWLFVNGRKIHCSKLDDYLEYITRHEKQTDIKLTTVGSIEIFDTIYKYRYAPNNHIGKPVWGTSRISHRKDIASRWPSFIGRGEDCLFAKDIHAEGECYMSDAATYMVCHVPNTFDI